eukprot:gene5317-7381_t
MLKNPKSIQHILNAKPKKIVVSGPSGFLGTRVLDAILNAHEKRIKHNIDPGEILLLSASPGRLMERLGKRYGPEKMKTLRASRVDYYTQHDVDVWTDHLGSLGLGGDQSVFVNLAAVAGPRVGKLDAMMDVNYKAPIAAAKACSKLGFGHWIQSSTQATTTERAGQVSYSRAKAMADFALSQFTDMNVTIAVLGLLYCKLDGKVGQAGEGLNLIDLALLPLTPILGDGSARLQPQEINDASERIAFLALTETSIRPIQQKLLKQYCLCNPDKLRVYDAVGPEIITMLEVLRKFAKYQGNRNFRPVHIGYRNMENILNVKSLGNLNRQFVSLLRSEQDSRAKIQANPQVWESILEDSKLLRIDEAFLSSINNGLNGDVITDERKPLLKARRFPYGTTVKHVWNNTGVIRPGIWLSLEIIQSYLFGRKEESDLSHKNPESDL